MSGMNLTELSRNCAMCACTRFLNITASFFLEKKRCYDLAAVNTKHLQMRNLMCAKKLIIAKN